MEIDKLGGDEVLSHELDEQGGQNVLFTFLVGIVFPCGR